MPIFEEGEFTKRLRIGDELEFDKNLLSKLRIDLTWVGTDLDLCAFLLDQSGLMRKKTDLVYYNSQLRWKTKRAFNDPDFNPLEGEVSIWPNESYRNKRVWMDETLPLSGDGSVIGSWDDMAEDEDDDCVKQETIHILLNDVETEKHETIVLAAVVAPKEINEGKTFADAHNPIATIYDAKTDKVIAEYRLASVAPGKDAVCFGKLQFNQESAIWNFIPMADGYKGGLAYLATEIFD